MTACTADLRGSDDLERDVVAERRQRDRQFATNHLDSHLRERLPLPGIERPDGIRAILQTADREARAGARLAGLAVLHPDKRVVAAR
jgi:hypothetical protein